MDPNRWRQIDELFSAVRDGTVAEREAVLTRIGDGGLRAEVESLLAAHDQPSSFIDAAAFEVPPLAGDDVRPDSPSGSIIGHYRIGELIGTGAMGAVYAAEQESPSRTVALKLLRCAPGRDDLAARLFQREGQALARLQHPAIATIYEAGRSDDGWHYFAMERVCGVPLTQHVREQELSLRERLELFCVICDAVHYAHQRGVIHRDLKPSNILVEENGQPKVLDFGLARITDPDADVTDATQAGAFHGTVAYASPEQLNGKPHDIDARSDVYSLGVILFELLTNQLPIDVRGLTLAEAARLICEQRPPPVGSIRRELRGDLETIVGKSLEKEPDRRYSSAAALADDIKRYLRDEPVEAMPDSGLYMLRKAIWRHRRMAAASATFVVFILVAMIGIFVEWRSAEAARIHAENAEQAQIELRVAADHARIDAKRQAEEAKHAEASAKKLQRQAQEVADCVLVLLHVRGDMARAVPRFRDTLARMRRVHSDEPLHVAKFIHNLATLLWIVGEYPESAKLFREALAIRRENGGQELGRTLSDYGSVLFDSGDYVEAEKVFREAIDDGLNRPMRPPPSPYVGLGQTLVRLKRYDEAEKWLLDCLDLLRDGPPRPDHERHAIETLIELYEARAAIDPTGDDAAKAAEWRSELEALPKPSERP